MRPRGLVSIVLTPVVLAAAVPVLAAKLPEWAEAIAEQAAPPGSGAEEDWRALLSDTRIAVQADGSLRFVHRLAFRAERDDAGEIWVGGSSHDEASKISKPKVWHLPPGGKTKRGRRTAIDVTLDSSFLTDQKTRFASLGAVEKGSLAFFEFESLERLDNLALAHRFLEDGAVDLARFEVALPPGWTARHDWVGAEGPAPEVRGETLSWELRDLPGDDEPEELGEKAADRAPLLLLLFVPPEGQAPADTCAAADWTELALWYEKLAQGRDAVTPEIEAAAAGILSGVEKDPFRRIAALGRFVRDGVRYVAREIGVGGYRPRPADQVLLEKLGDCKDKGTLFRALLAADGLAGFPIIVNSALERSVSERIPALQSFNHFVVGVLLPPGAEPPREFEPTTVTVEGLGRLLVVDTTDETASVGALPAALAGKRALLVAGGDSRLIALPTGHVAAHRIERWVQVRPDPGGFLEVREEISRIGEPAARARGAWRRSSAEFLQDHASALALAWPGAEVVEHEVEEETFTGCFKERIRWTAPSGSTVTTLQLFPGVLDDLPRVSLRRRESAVLYPFAMTLRSESVVRGIAPGTGYPSPLDARGQGWSVRTRFVPEGDVVRATWELTLSRRRFAPEEFGELQDFWRAARRAAAAAVAIAAPSE